MALENRAQRGRKSLSKVQFWIAFAILFLLGVSSSICSIALLLLHPSTVNYFNGITQHGAKVAVSGASQIPHAKRDAVVADVPAAFLEADPVWTHDGALPKTPATKVIDQKLLEALVGTEAAEALATILPYLDFPSQGRGFQTSTDSKVHEEADSALETPAPSPTKLEDTEDAEDAEDAEEPAVVIAASGKPIGEWLDIVEEIRRHFFSRIAEKSAIAAAHAATAAPELSRESPVVGSEDEASGQQDATEEDEDPEEDAQDIEEQQDTQTLTPSAQNATASTNSTGAGAPFNITESQGDANGTAKPLLDAAVTAPATGYPPLGTGGSSLPHWPNSTTLQVEKRLLARGSAVAAPAVGLAMETAGVPLRTGAAAPRPSTWPLRAKHRHSNDQGKPRPKKPMKGIKHGGEGHNGLID